jgi:hypothetical protein
MTRAAEVSVVSSHPLAAVTAEWLFLIAATDSTATIMPRTRILECSYFWCLEWHDGEPIRS